MSQTLGGDRGALTLSAAREDYWNADRPMASWSVGYNNDWHNISYGVSWTYSKNGSPVVRQWKYKRPTLTTSFWR
ncbi:outer membrane usher protein LpfC [Enterobacter cloacae]|uniref:Outer membrane usher protein LpfC n=1 Tax=Enterobacter cloacae TaxID=550 RepID=A0A377M3F1_ENTCL|nr:outer membrane usher protein LpfC [Enterobacter cloacae]